MKKFYFIICLMLSVQLSAQTKYVSKSIYIEDRARVQSGTYPNFKYGFVDKEGNEVIAVKYDGA